MNDFYTLFCRYLKDRNGKVSWDRIEMPSDSQILPYSEITKGQTADAGGVNSRLLERLAVVKLNGGLGTTMGCTGPKSAIEILHELTFLDMTVMQIQNLNQKNSVSVPLILMNSFNTDEETRKIIKKYSNHGVEIFTFNQSKYPRIDADSLMILPTSTNSDRQCWYPPGHGDFFASINNCGLLDALIEDGKDFIFVSNIDNLGATVDQNILQYLADSTCDYLMEVTDKTKADVKGGTLVNLNGKLSLLEVAQVPSDRMPEFTSPKKFKVFNTNNIWLSTKSLKKILAAGNLSLEIIVNQKTLDGNGTRIIQLETAIGAAIKHFSDAKAVNVPRSRFLPVKTCSDLLLLQSDLYTLNDGHLTLSSKRSFPGIPCIRLGDPFKKVRNFLSRVPSPINILELDHLTVVGDVTFGRNVTLRGTVIIVANNGSRIDIPSGSILEDKVISGSLAIMDH